MDRFSLLAFFVGNLCEILAYVTLSAILMLYTHGLVRQPGMSSHDVTVAAIALRSHGWLRVVGYATGKLSALLGGFLGGMIGRRRPVLSGMLAYTLSACLALLIAVRGLSRDPIALQMAMIVLGAASAALGGWLASKATGAKPLQSEA